jgi:ribosome-binding protein aMBF1 (putative translation factor)
MNKSEKCPEYKRETARTSKKPPKLEPIGLNEKFFEGFFIGYGLCVREWREKNKYSQAELAECIDVDERTIRNCEKGRMIDVTTYIKLEKIIHKV